VCKARVKLEGANLLFEFRFVKDSSSAVGIYRLRTVVTRQQYVWPQIPEVPPQNNPPSCSATETSTANVTTWTFCAIRMPQLSDRLTFLADSQGDQLKTVDTIDSQFSVITNDSLHEFAI
jgi:hypothetical protein